MNEKFKQRLIGLIAVLALLFALTWLLPRRSGDGEGPVPSTVVPLAGGTGGEAAVGTPADELGDAEGAPRIPPDERSPPDESRPAPASSYPPRPKPAQPINPAPPAIAATKPASKPAVPAIKTDKPPKPEAASKAIAITPPPSGAAAKLPPTASAPATAADAKAWYVQVGSFADQNNAQTTLSLLTNIGYRGEVADASGTAGKRVYRVRLGPFADEAAARAAQDKVAHQGYPQSRAIGEPLRAR